MNMFVKQVIIKGWKKLVMAITLGTILLGYVQQANAQNIVVDEILRTKYDSLTLDPNTSIKENCRKIDLLIYSHRKNNYANFIVVRGHYVGYHNTSYDFPIGTIRVKDKNNKDVKEQIIDVLMNLYSHSLDKKFQVSSKEYNFIKVGNGYFYHLLSSSPLYKRIHDKVVDESYTIYNFL